MQAVRQKHTAPEMIVRKTLHSLGFRFRLHRRHLPGSPDIVLPRFKSVVFVHGCFWHRHPGCRKASTPKTRREFWQAKFVANVARDARNETALTKAGWRVLVVWECQTKNLEELRSRLIDFLNPNPGLPKIEEGEDGEPLEGLLIEAARRDAEAGPER